MPESDPDLQPSPNNFNDTDIAPKTDAESGKPKCPKTDLNPDENLVNEIPTLVVNLHNNSEDSESSDSQYGSPYELSDSEDASNNLGT